MHIFGILLLLMFTGCTETKILNERNNKPAEEISTSNMEVDILKYINEHRLSIGKTALKPSETAASEAEKHSASMASRNIAFGHGGFDNRINKIRESIGGVLAAAENVAYGQMSAKAVVDGWLNSAGHRKNIEGDYNLTGIGIAEDKRGVLYFTQIFLKK